MLKRKVKLKITAASRQTIRLQAPSIRARCLECGREVEILTRFEAAAVLGVDGETFDHLVAQGRIHTRLTVSGSLRVCKDSLFLM